MSETQHYAGRYMTAEDIRGLADLQDQYGIAMGRMIDAEKEVARLTAENARLAAAEAELRAAFIKHRSTTHEVTPMVCLTCRESDDILSRPASERGQALLDVVEAARDLIAMEDAEVVVDETDAADWPARMDAAHLARQEANDRLRRALRGATGDGADA